jgi:hypothetical protein
MTRQTLRQSTERTLTELQSQSVQCALRAFDSDDFSKRMDVLKALSDLIDKNTTLLAVCIGGENPGDDPDDESN